MATLSRKPFQHFIEDESDSTRLWPYRTTPLVLPGAKVKKDFGPTESYLRHHPNPMFRQAPPHPLLPHELAMKQKVADTVLQKIEEQAGPGVQIVRHQFNSPIGLYSDQNIVDTINAQTAPSKAWLKLNSAATRLRGPAAIIGAGLKLGKVLQLSSDVAGGYLDKTGKKHPIAKRFMSGATSFYFDSLKKTVVFDPVKSETYKALHDQEIGDYAQEVTPLPTKVFSPVKRAVVRPQSPRAVPHPVPGPHSVNATGQTHEEIQQSNTFKRLMHMVQTEGVY